MLNIHSNNVFWFHFIFVHVRSTRILLSKKHFPWAAFLLYGLAKCAVVSCIYDSQKSEFWRNQWMRRSLVTSAAPLRSLRQPVREGMLWTQDCSIFTERTSRKSDSFSEFLQLRVSGPSAPTTPGCLHFTSQERIRKTKTLQKCTNNTSDFLYYYNFSADFPLTGWFRSFVFRLGLCFVVFVRLIGCCRGAPPSCTAWHEYALLSGCSGMTHIS